MFIEKLSIINFKNYSQSELKFNSKLNCFVGDNGVGKTNLLDAIYYLCMSKSYFQGSDVYTIHHGKDYMVLQGIFQLNDEKTEIYCGLKPNKRKILRKNKKEYTRISEHIGQFPVVMVSPSDSNLILGGSDERRKYINAVISQYNNSYLENTIQYNRILAQRNKLLKNIQNTTNAGDLLDIYDKQMIPLGEKIYNDRKDFISRLTPVFQSFYKTISENNEEVEITYNSQLNKDSLGNLLKNSRKADCAAQFSTNGIHKDDIEMLMKNQPIKKTGSQGQQKSYLVALKMAQFTFLREVKNMSPLLLLDDIFDKFDANRVQNILNLVSEKDFGQIFITHTNQERMKQLLSGYTDNYSLFIVSKDGIKKLDHEKK